jgi:adenosine kinase
MAILEKYDVKLNSAILCEEKHLPVFQELIKDFQVKYVAGGATQNSIRVAQWMTQEAGSTQFTGCIGNDEFGKQLEKSAQGDGVATYYRVDEKTPTGSCAVLINSKERSLMANLSAANEYKPDHLNSPEFAKVWQAADAFYIAGFFLTVSPESIMTVAEHANEKNKAFCMNLSAPFITEFFNEPLVAALPYVDFLFGNESEAVAFGTKMGYTDLSVAGVALEIAKIPKTNGKRERYIVFTQGADATIVVQGEEVTKYIVPPLDAEKIVDVNGAGDAFVGGFLSAFNKGQGIDVCVGAGHYAASVILGVSGTELPSEAPTFDGKPAEELVKGESQEAKKAKTAE